MPISDYPHGFNNGVAIRDMPVLNAYTGKVWWVCSPTSPSAGGVNTTHGARGGFSNPYPSLATAIVNPKMVNGDIIAVKAQHVETITSPLSTVVSCCIIGLGEGSLRPQFTANLNNAAQYAINLLNANSSVINLYFPASLSALAGIVYKGAAGCAFWNNFVLCGAYDTYSIGLSASANNTDTVVFNNEFHVTASGPKSVFNLPSGPLRVTVRFNMFDGMSMANAWTSGALYASGSCTVGRITNNDFLWMYASAGGINFGSNVKGGPIRDNFFGGGALGYMLAEGGCYCANNYETADTTKTARLFPTSAG